MVGSAGGSSPSLNPSAPKILLAKPSECSRQVHFLIVHNSNLCICGLNVYRLQDHDHSPSNIVQTNKALLQYFSSSSFMRRKRGNNPANQLDMGQINVKDKEMLDLFVIPYKNKDDSPGAQCESYVSSLWKLHDQVLSMTCPWSTRNVSERDWLKSSAKIRVYYGDDSCNGTRLYLLFSTLKKWLPDK